MRRLLIILLSGFSSLLQADPSIDTPPMKVLAIHSYHPDFFWTQSLVKGIEQGMATQPLTLEHAYLDIKRNQSDAYFRQLQELYRIKLLHQDYDAILTTDNAALALVNDLAANVGNVPVIFSGLNSPSYDEYSQIKRLTGVEELINIPDNLALIKRLHPDVKRVWLVLDESFSSRDYWRAIERQLEASGSAGLDVQRLHGLSFNALIDRVGELKHGDALLFLSYFTDINGKFMPHDQLLESIGKATSIPIYGTNSFMLPHGIIGGIMVDGEHHGHLQAQLALQSINQTTLPKVRSHVTQLMFSHEEAKRFQLPLSRFSQAIVSDRPQSLWDEYRLALILIASLVLLSMLIIFGTKRQIKFQRRTQRKMAQNKSMYEAVFVQSHQVIALLDDRGRVVSTNEAFRRLFPQWQTRNFLPLQRWPEWVNQDRLKMHINNLVEGQSSHFEISLLSEFQHELHLDVAIKALPNHSRAKGQLLFEAREITQRKIAEQKLQRSELEYRMLYEHQPVILMTLDHQSRIQSVNQSACDWLNLSKQELLGHRVSDFYDETTLSPQQLLEQAGGDIARREIKYHGKDLSIWIRETIRSTPVKSQCLLVGEDISEQRRMEKQLRFQAEHDCLTGLFNRTRFEQQLDTALNDARLHQVTHALFYIDLDQFRVINDTMGHTAGDEALKQVASQLKAVLPSDAILARISGDEFAIICFQCDEQQAQILGQQILSQIIGMDFYWKNQRLLLSCAIGVRMLDDKYCLPQQAHTQANTACFAAKQEGSGRMQFYRFEDQELKRHEREMHFVNQIHNALEEDRIEVFAQPIVPVSAFQSDKLYFEVLVRMRGQDGQTISPGDFIPAAERYNLAHLIDRRMVEKTLHWFEQYPQQLCKIGMISINLSGRSMSDQDFIEFLLARLNKTSVPCEIICLEITETAAIGNLTDAIAFCQQLKSLGCTIALDDFGSGLSSFGYLKNLPVDIIKIDGQFVRDIVEDETDFAMVRAIHQLASQMGKKTVAEFVENQQILDRLEQLGVDYAQGYFFSTPKPLGVLMEQSILEAAQVS